MDAGCRIRPLRGSAVCLWWVRTLVRTAMAPVGLHPRMAWIYSAGFGGDGRRLGSSSVAERIRQRSATLAAVPCIRLVALQPAMRAATCIAARGQLGIAHGAG